MAFDQPTRNRLNSFVGEARALLTEEFARQLQSDYGIDPGSGRVDDVAGIIHLNDRQRETARILRDTLHHYTAGKGDQKGRSDKKTRIAAIDRIVREQAFTVLNRLAALRMAEARGLLITSIAEGVRSDGFQLYQQLAGVALGETDEAHIVYIFSLFDEFAVDLPVLFDRFSPEGRLFPSVRVLRQLLALINDEEIASLWAEDETIGWIYQYFNSIEERRQMRQASSAPRNSRELAVRNQFFTPRYVVEFLTDNTLGRIWHEMTKGQTRLADQCRYLVRRPAEMFIGGKRDQYEPDRQVKWLAKVKQGDFSDLPERATEEELIYLALTIDGYSEAKRLGYGDLLAWAAQKMSLYDGAGELPDSAIELWLLIFAMQREHRIITGSGPAGHQFLAAWQALYQAWKDAVQRDTSSLTQEELLQQPVFIPHRPFKDPRDIKMLDPACGSMHFGLYAFDLFETIYEEAWEMGVLGEWAEDYCDKTGFMRDVPRLIIEHNIHGIDIDARAVQIAGLSLWLRAQRSWQAQRVPATDRPTVARSNVVVAEPMPGDEEELEAFLTAQFGDTAQDQIVAGLVRRVFEAMKLAGEVGSLLKIDEEIADDIAAAKRKWIAAPKILQVGLFERPQQTALPMEIPVDSDEQFWEQIESRIYTALQQFAERAIQGEAYRHRLFAEDAARGFAFIDVCRSEYDVALMNPPFGEATSSAKVYIRGTFKDSSNDLYATFVDRWADRLTVRGRLGAITSNTGFFLSAFSRWREKVVLSRAPIDVVIDLGADVLDRAVVNTAAYCIERGTRLETSLFFRLLDIEDKPDGLRDALRSLYISESNDSTFIIKVSQVRNLPDSTFAYWGSPRMFAAFKELTPLGDVANVEMGMSTKNDFRFVRSWWEVLETDIGFSDVWAFYAKGGNSEPFTYEYDTVVLAHDDFKELKAELLHKYPYLKGDTGWVLHPEYSYGKSGLTYGRRVRRFSLNPLPGGMYFSEGSSAVFPQDERTTLVLMGLLSSNPTRALLGMITSIRKMEAGYIAAIPIPNLDQHETRKIGELAKRGVEILIARNWVDELSPQFVLPAYMDIARENLVILQSATDIAAAINEAAYMAYGFSERDTELIERELPSIIGIGEPQFNYQPSQSEQSSSLLSYLLGSVFGRWDIRYATREKEPPPLPDPFDPLPVCPPGMLQNAEGLPAAPEDVPADYPLRISWSGMLIDDDGHAEDIERRVGEALRVIWKERADDIEVEACSFLGVDSLRDYFGYPDRFFDDHLSRYSKSRRYAPIYWPLTTTNGSYTLWLYYHRLDASTLYKCVNDFVDIKLKDVQRLLDGLRNRQRTSDEEDQFEQLTNRAVELETFRKDLLELARFWRPNLNDGVEITAAPLYALFSHRNWRNRLEGTWGKLQEGEYDWAHLAMSIWPSRVVPKCVEDRSLAIAHDIEQLFWVDEDEFWRPLGSPAEEEAHQAEVRQSEERDRLRELFTELAEGEGRYLPAMQVWQSLDEGQWDHRPLGLHLYPERAAEAAFDDATRVYPHLVQRGQKLLQKDTKKNRQLLAKLLVERGTPELVAAVEGTLAEETTDFATLWQELEKGRRDDLPLALALWPERVVGKVLRDPEMATKHGLFDFFWYDEPGTGVRRRQPIDREITREVQRRGGDKL